MRFHSLIVRMAAVGVLAAAVAAATGPTATVEAQGPSPTDPNVFSELRWRNIGPHRASRTKALDGVPSQPHTFYIGVVNGGVWKTTDAGRTWMPIFDDQPTGSIGAIAVAPSNPNVIYVGTGEAQQRPDLATGDGMYKSTDAGRTWTHLGLRDTQQIAQIVVDPKNADRLFVAALGHPYGPNTERGIFRSTERRPDVRARALQGREHRRASTSCIDPANPDIGLRRRCGRRGRGRGRTATSAGRAAASSSPPTAARPGGRSPRACRPGTAIGSAASASASRRASRRACSSWSKRERPAASTARTTPARRWTRVNSDERVRGAAERCHRHPRPSDQPRHRLRADDRHVEVHRRRPHVHRAFAARPAATTTSGPGSTRRNPDIIALTSDQGAIVTAERRRDVEQLVQPADRGVLPRHHRQRVSVPRLQRPAGERLGRASPSRGDDGQITFREWSPVGVEEYGYVAPDPLDPDIVYGGKVSRWDRRTGQVQNVGPEAAARRRLPGGAHHAGAVLAGRIRASCSSRRTCSGRPPTAGSRWEQISPDLTRPDLGGARRTSASTRPGRKRARRSAASSTRSRRRTSTSSTIWAGTDDGLIHVTRDGGKTWSDVTPPELKPWAKVSLMDASHFDANTAYAAINTFRLDDLRPHIYRTRDGGKTWTAHHRRASRTAASSTSCARIRSGAACSSPAPSRRSTSRSTTATTGSRCA